MERRWAESGWHDRERVPTGQERIPGLLSDLVTEGHAVSAWAGLTKCLGAWPRAELLAGVAEALFALLPDLDRRHRAAALEFLARQAWWASDSNHRFGADGPALRAVLGEGANAVVPLLADPDARVRACAARALEFLPAAGPVALQALQALAQQAPKEADLTALVCQLGATGSLMAETDTGDPDLLLRPWLSDPRAHVRLAAAAAVSTAGAGELTDGLGTLVADALRETRGTALADLPGATFREGAEAHTLRLVDHREEVLSLTRRLTAHTDAALREAGVRTAGARLMRWRLPSAELWEQVVAGLDDAPPVAAAALTTLARGGSQVAPYADRVARSLDTASWFDTYSFGLRSNAALALTGLGDRRALPWIAERFGSYELRPTALPAAWVPELLPVLRRVVGDDPRNTGIAAALGALAGWGPAAAPAVPELVRLLDSPYARPAVEVLGRIGPAAADATDALVMLARGARRPPREGTADDRTPARWHGAQSAAWAYWRVSGDPEPALRVIGAAARAGLGHPVLGHLADLGPAAARWADAVRPMLTCPGAWSRVGAANAWWRITGDAATAVDVLVPELAPLRAGAADPLVLPVVRLLGAIGGPAAAAVPVLTAARAAERRYAGDILRDEEFCSAVDTAVASIVGDTVTRTP